MKHLIFVHSHLSFVVINQYFVENNIDPEDCLFIVTARYSNFPKGHSYTNFIHFPNELLPNGYKRVFYKNNIITGIKNIRYIEDRINSFFHGESFFLYLTTTSLDFFSALVTMKQCKGYYLMEEGSASYYYTKEVPKPFHGIAYPFVLMLAKIMPRFYALRCAAFSFNNKYFLGTIATTRKAFPDFPGKHIIINPPFKKVVIDYVPDVILSIDSSIMISLDSIFPTELYKKIAVFFKQQEYQKIAYKFHPKFYVNPSLLEIFRNGLIDIFGKEIVELDEDCQLENYFLSYPIDFCSDFSSVGIYASSFGRKCYSYMNIMKELYPNSSYSEDYSLIPKIVFELYTMIPSI